MSKDPSQAHEGVVAAPPSAGRITVALTKKSVENLDKVQELTNFSKTDIVNRSIAMYAFIEGELEDGGELLLRRKDGTQYIIKPY